MSSIAENRKKWLRAAKRITEACVARASLLDQPCLGDELDKARLLRIAQYTRTITTQVERLASVKTPELGCQALLKRAPSSGESVTLALLVCARLDRDASTAISTVNDIVTLVACRDPDIAVEVRSMFRSSGSLHPFVSLSYSATLDESRVRLTESALSTILALPDDSTATICDVVARLRSIRQ